MGKLISRQSELVELAAELGVRSDWHEPDQQGVDAYVEGNDRPLDNAMGPDPDGAHEPNVLILKDGVDVAAVNLATLLSWAARPPQPAPPAQPSAGMSEGERKALVVVEIAERIASAVAAVLGEGQIDKALSYLEVLTCETSTRTATAVKDQQLADALSRAARTRLDQYGATRQTG